MDIVILSQLVFFVVAVILVSPFCRTLEHPAYIYCLTWIFTLGLHLIGFVIYEYPPISINLLGVQTLFSVCFIFGSFFPPLTFKWQERAKENQLQPQLELGMSILFLISVAVTASLVSYEIASNGGAVLDIEQTRLTHWDQADQDASAISTIKSIFRPVVTAFLFMFPFYRNDIIKRTLSATSFFVVVVGEALLVGGRAFLGFALAGLTFAATLGKRFPVGEVGPNGQIVDTDEIRRSSNPLLTFTIRTFGFLIVFFLTFGLFPVIRNTNLAGQEDFFLTFETGQSTVAPIFREIGELCHSQSVASFAYGTHYLTSPMMRANYLLNETDAATWYLFGQNNFPVLSKVASRISGGKTGEQLVKARIKDAQPYGQNPWIGGVADIFIDFGILGGAAFMLFFGIFSGWIYNSMVSLRQSEYYMLYSLAMIAILSFPFFSAIRLSMVINTVLVAFMLLFLRAIIAPRKI